MLMQNMRWFVPTMVQQGAFYHSGAGEPVTTTINDLLHRLPTSFAQFVQDYVQSNAQDFQNS
jgi:hypothetical protein